VLVDELVVLLVDWLTARCSTWRSLVELEL
jgi:hypothetical protein